MYPLKGVYKGVVEPSLTKFLQRRMPERPAYLGRYESDTLIMRNWREQIINAFGNNEDSVREISKMRAAFWWTHYDLEGERMTFIPPSKFDPHPATADFIVELMTEAYVVVKRKYDIQYEIRPPANSGYPWYISGRLVHGVRLLNYLLALITISDYDNILKYVDYVLNHSNIPPYILYSYRLQDSGPDKINPIVRGNTIIVPNDIYMEKRVRAINIASKLLYAVGVLPVTLLQKLAYETPLSGNDPIAIDRMIKNFQRNNASFFYSDFSKFDFTMAGKIGVFVDSIKEKVIERVKPEWSRLLHEYLRINRERFVYIYPYFGSNIILDASTHFASGRRDTAVHGTLSNMSAFIDSMLKFFGVERTKKLITHNSQVLFKCFSDDAVMAFSGELKQYFDDFRDFHLSNLTQNWGFKVKEEKPPKYLGRFYDMGPFNGKVDPYAIVRKTLSPERVKADKLTSIGLIARHQMLRDTLGPRMGDEWYRKLLLILQSTGYPCLSHGYLRWYKPKLEPEVFDTDIKRAMIDLSRKINFANVSAGDMNDVFYGVMNIDDGDLVEYFDALTRSYSIEEVEAQLQGYAHLAVEQVMSAYKDVKFRSSVYETKRVVALAVDPHKNSKIKSEAALYALKLLTPNI